MIQAVMGGSIVWITSVAPGVPAQRLRVFCHVTPPELHIISLLLAAPMKRLLPWYRKGIDPSWMLRYWDSYLNCCLKTRRYLLTCHSGAVQCVVCSAQNTCTAKAKSYDWIPHPPAASRAMKFQGRVVGSPSQQQSGLFTRRLSQEHVGRLNTGGDKVLLSILLF